MAEWVAELTGEAQHLKALALLFKTPAVHVVERLEDGRFFLKSSDFASEISRIDIWKHARTLVTRMNAAAFLKFGHFQPVSVTRVARWDDVGREIGLGYSVNWGKVPLISRRLEAFVEYTPNRPFAQDDPANEGAPDRFAPVEDWMVASPDSDVDTVCGLLVWQADDWRVLAFILEIIEGDVGQPSKMQRLGWGTVTELSLFKDTANNPKAIGTAARHGRHKRAPPAKPMALHEAQALIGRLVTAWLQWKVDKKKGHERARAALAQSLIDYSHTAGFNVTQDSAPRVDIQDVDDLHVLDASHVDEMKIAPPPSPASGPLRKGRKRKR
jgi:hypothetical protein